MRTIMTEIRVNVEQRIREAFDDMPLGTELTVAQIAAKSNNKGAGLGALVNTLNAAASGKRTLHGIEVRQYPLRAVCNAHAFVARDEDSTYTDVWPKDAESADNLRREHYSECIFEESFSGRMCCHTHEIIIHYWEEFAFQRPDLEMGY